MAWAHRLFVVFLAWGVATSANAACRSDAQDFKDTLDAFLQQHVTEELPDLLEASIRDTPRFTSESQQDSIPSAVPGLATIVDEAGFSSLLSAAFDQTLGSDGDDDNEAITLNASPFAIVAAAEPAVFFDQARYERTEYELMRRVGGSVSLGGKGERFDRNGDGMPDDALGAKAIDDIVTWEVRVRLFGSRDRRQKDNYDKLFEAVDEEALLALANAQAMLFQDDRLAGFTVDGRRDCIDEDRWADLKEAEWFQEAAIAPIESMIGANRSYRAALEEIDDQLLVTAVLTGVERDTEFGPDKIGVGARASWREFTVNFDWMEMESTTNRSDVNEFKVGLQWERKVLTDLVGERGVDAALSGLLEIFENSPDVEHDTTVKVQAKLEIPLFRAVSLPISVTWANHEDLLSKDDEVIGRFGINVDTSGLMELAAGGSD